MAHPKLQVLVDWNNDGDFTDANDDITSDVWEMRLDHLRDLMSEYMTGAVMDIVVRNDTHKYSPPNGASPLTGNLVPGRRVWVRSWYPFDSFAGAAADLPDHDLEEDTDWTWVTHANYEAFRTDGSGAATHAENAVGATYLEFSDTDVEIAANYKRILNATVHGGLLIRYVDQDNYAYVYATPTALQLRKCIATVDSLVTSIAHTWADNTSKFLVVKVHGTNVRVFVDAVEIMDTTLNDAAINAGTKHGLFASGNCDHEWEDFGGYRSLFAGTIDSIKPRPQKGDQYAYIKCFDWFELLKAEQLHFVNYSDSALDHSGDTLGYILSSLGLSGAASWRNIYRQWDGGTRLVNDGSSATVTERVGIKAVTGDMLSVLYMYQDEEDGFIYIDGEGWMCLEERGHRAAAPHTTSMATYYDTYDGTNPGFSKLAWDDGQVNVENRIVATVIRSTIYEALTLYVNEQAANTFVSISFNVAESKDFLIELRDFDGALAWTTPVATTDYTANANADGSGADLTADLTVAEQDINKIDGKFRRIRVTFGANAGYLTKFQIRGTGITYEDSTNVEDEDATSITAYGERIRELPLQFIDRDDVARAMLASRLARRKDPKTMVDLELAAGDKWTLHHMIQRHISDRVTVNYSDMGINEAFFVEGETWQVARNGWARQTLQLRGV